MIRIRLTIPCSFISRFGFVEFATAEAAQQAHDSMQGQSVDGRQIVVDYASELRDGAPRNDFRQGAWRGGGGGRGNISYEFYYQQAFLSGRELVMTVLISRTRFERHPISVFHIRTSFLRKVSQKAQCR